MQVQTTKGPVPAAKLSSLIASLYTAWENEIHMHAFALSGTHVTPEEVATYLPEYTGPLESESVQPA